MPLILDQFRTKFPVYDNLPDRELIDSLHTKFYSDIPKLDFARRFVLGDKAITKDVPPPKESILAQFKKFTQDPRPLEVKAGAAIEKSFRTNEVIAEMAVRAAMHPFTKEGRKGKKFKLSPEAIQAFRRQPDLTSASEAALNLIGTQGRFRQLAEEKLPRTREGVIDVLPLKIFGVPTAEIPREALKEITDFFGGFFFNPKQPLVITPVLSSILGLTKLAIIKVLRKVADRLKAKRAFNTVDAFKEIEKEVIKQGGKPQVKLLAGKERKLLTEGVLTEEGKLQKGFRSIIKGEAGFADIEKFKKAVTPENITKQTQEALQKLLVKVGKRIASEEQGQSILDDMVEKRISPASSMKKFWSETFPLLDEKQREIILSHWKGTVGIKPGDIYAVQAEARPGIPAGTEFIAKTWEELGTKLADTFGKSAFGAESLEGADRGLVSLMEFANRAVEGITKVEIIPKLGDIVKKEEERLAGVNPFKLLPEKFRTKVQEFFLPLSTLPQSEQLKFARSKTMGAVARAEAFIIKTKKRIDKFPLDDRIQMFKFLDGQIDITDLPNDIRVLAKSIQQRQIQIGKALVRRGLLSEGAFENLKGKYVHYIYARHIIGNKADINPNQIVTPSGKLNMSYLISRNPNLTRNDRIALGLIEDAGQAIPTGMGKALSDIAKFDYLEKIADNPEWVWQPATVVVNKKRWGIGRLIIEVEDIKNTIIAQPDNELAKERFKKFNDALEHAKAQTGNVPKDFRQLPNTKNFGNLAGAFVRKPIFDDLMPLASSFSDSNRGSAMKIAFQIEQQGVGLFKIGKVPFNPPTVFRNVVSNFIQNNMRGRPLALIPGDLAKAVRGIIKKEPMWIQAKRDGLFQTNFAVSELNEIFGALNSINATNWSSFLAQIHKLAKYYGKIDDIAKYTIYRQLRHGGLIDLTIKPPSSPEEALLEAQKWGMDYSLASRSIKEARRHILPLVTYQYKIAPLILESFQKRPWVIGKYMALLGVAGFGVAGEVARRKFDITPKQWAKMLKDLPQYIKRNSTYAILPYKSPEGNWQWVNLEYYFPWGNWMSLFRDFKEGDYTQMLRSAGVSNPFLELLVAFKGTPQGRIPKDPFTGKNIYNELDSPAQQWLKIAEFMYLRWGPSFLSKFGAVGFTTRIGKKDKWGRTVTPWQALGRWFGFNIISVSPRQTGAIKQARIRELRLELNKLLRDPRVSRPTKQKIIKKFTSKAQKIIAGTE